MSKPPLRNIIQAALNLAILDGGFIIAIQVIDFLLNYFGASLFGRAESIQGISRGHFITLLLSILNLSVIITRCTGLTRGVKFSLGACYEHAIRRWPLLILLFIIGGFLLLGISMPLFKILSQYANVTMPQYSKIINLLILALIPYGILACTFVVDRDQNPLRAIHSTFNLVKNRLNVGLLFRLSLLYSVPLYFDAILAHTNLNTYMALFAALWMLFCHVVTLIIYVSTSEEFNSTSSDHKTTTKVIIA